MIAQILSRSFLLPWLEPVQDQLAALITDEGDPSGKLTAALAAIGEVLESGMPGQPDDSVDSTTRRRGGWDDQSALDEQAFVSRDPVTSLLQSALEERIETEHADLIVHDGEDASGRRQGDDELPAVTDTRLDIDGVEFDPKRRLFGPFEQSDVRWIAEIGLAKAFAKFRDRHPFNPRPADPVQLADDARLVIVGDWGSGLPRAQRVAEHMRFAITEGLNAGRQVHAIHLGDVYYSGWAREYQRRFLPYWPVLPQEADAVFSWSVNGNHDMYSGGHGYFKTLLADPRFACQQHSSWFSIENDHWRIVGLDTAWDERGIHDPRTERGLADPQASTLKSWAAGDDRPFLLLSHHQLFSGYQAPGPYVRTKLADLLDAGRVRGWFWGHEHKCVVYQPYGGVEYGRCIGHGGMPVYAIGEPKHDPPAIEWVEQRAVDGLFESWAMYGFAVADFDGPHAHIAYIDEHGQLAYEEQISAR